MTSSSSSVDSDGPFMWYVVQRYVKKGKTVEVKVPLQFKDHEEFEDARDSGGNFPLSISLFKLWESKNHGWYVLDLDRGERTPGGLAHPDGRIHVYRARFTYDLPAEEEVELGCDLSPVKEKTLEEWDVIFRANNGDLVSNWTALNYLSVDRVTEILKEAKDAALAYESVYSEHWRKETEGFTNINKERRERERKAQQEEAGKRKLKAAETRKRNKESRAKSLAGDEDQERSDHELERFKKRLKSVADNTETKPKKSYKKAKTSSASSQ